MVLQYRKRYELLQQKSGRRCTWYARGLQYRKRYELLQLSCLVLLVTSTAVLQYRKRYELLQLTIITILPIVINQVTIPQAVWAVATCSIRKCWIEFLQSLQYRKRYELLQPPSWFMKEEVGTRYNTASGMSCCNFVMLSVMTGNDTLQYRKRYELLQRKRCIEAVSYEDDVTIPQAVWAVATKV